VSTSLRISLTILSAGFAVEGGAELYSLLTAGAFLPGTSLLFVLPAIVTLLGLLFLIIGRHEWDEVHRARIRRANLIFGLSILAGVVAGIEVALLATYPGFGVPLWAEVVFGAAAGAFLLGTFVTYAQLVFHLVTPPSKAALVAASLWALVVSIFVARTFAADLPNILATIGAHSFSIDYLISPVDYLASFLFVSYFLLLAAYVDAHVTVARRRAARSGRTTGNTAGVESPRTVAAKTIVDPPAPVISAPLLTRDPLAMPIPAAETPVPPSNPAAGSDPG
jgi:hypothetical protein